MFYLGRYTSSHGIVGDVLRYNATCCYDAMVTNGYTRTDDNPSAYPTIVANGDRVCRLLWFSSFHKILGMIRCIKLTIRPNLHMIAYADKSTIKHYGIIVDEDIIA